MLDRRTSQDGSEHPQQDLLRWAGVGWTTGTFPRGAVIFAQGDRGLTVMLVASGTVKLTVTSASGKEAVVGLVGRGTFFGEGCLAGQTYRTATATALTPTTVLALDNGTMTDRLRERPDFASAFLSHMLARNIRVQEDLLDQLFNSGEKRLARLLLRLSGCGDSGDAARDCPPLSQEVLASMVGTTRARVNLFMNRFRQRGFVEYSGRHITVKRSLLRVVLHD